jgi:RNA polymerase sigma factor (sigma-70 family)
MATAKLSDPVTRLGRLPSPPDPDAPDPDLLARFLADRDERAFALLVRRHGPAVLGVCRRVTGDHHLAEDAFQAVFVVLAAKAGSVRPRAALPAWLYGAYRTALRARTMADRRRKHERAAGTRRPAVQSDEGSSDRADLVEALDAEIARLPEHLRAAVVLCELEGRSPSSRSRP